MPYVSICAFYCNELVIMQHFALVVINKNNKCISFFWLCTRLLPLLLGARMSCHCFCFYRILLSMFLRARMTCNFSCCCKISLLLALMIVNFLLLLLTQKCSQTSYCSFEMLLPLLSCSRMLESKVDIHVVKLHKGDNWDWQVTIELFGNFFIC